MTDNYSSGWLTLDHAKWDARQRGIEQKNFRYIARNDQLHGILFAEHPEIHFYMHESIDSWLIANAKRPVK